MSFTVNETLKWLITTAAYLNSEIILMVIVYTAIGIVSFGDSVARGIVSLGDSVARGIVSLGDSVARGIVSLFLLPLGISVPASTYLFGDNSVLN